MTTYVVHNNGQPVSIGTVIANPLPAGLAAVALSDTDADRLLRQGWQWNPATLAVDIEPAPTADPLADPDAVAQVLAVLAALTPEQLQRVVTLGVAVTEPAAVDTLEQAVADGDAVTGVAVVADAAAAAQAAVDIDGTD